MNINRYIDHTLLKPNATIADIQQLCKEALEHDFFSVCVNSCHVKLAKECLKNSASVQVCSVIGFPLGAMSTEAKVAELLQAKQDGADEFDMVINIGWLKSGKENLVKEEIQQLKKAAGDAVLKVIIETCYLSGEEKIKASELAVAAGADFVKTSTGFGTGGATVEDILLMKKAVNGQAKLKASGGIRDYETAKMYIDTGVSRLGTSNGIAIINKTSSKNTY
ncbi:deoxyribose-phosphate aldolase [Kordia sp. YSTF-M3]|uniref:Deoxyribose-phosphate aldolase n=1 Tax=Kordia aestuariivivens TaxID=2759037 RepID=A0ABR7QCU6_9FLAO|nr:deoxyribose-phosphate aldolase [Kordia aestuariivivens]MBC8756201.1 deoxyribose-phosphate aldolase [Kordia aestuariivivens]